jgi:putative membrane protein
MKNKTYFGIIVVLLGSLCFAGTALAQGEYARPMIPEMPKEGYTPRPSPVGSNKSAPTSMSAADKAFMNKAANGGLMEVQWGKWAGQSAQNEDVKKFGNQMVTDHTKAYNELIDLAQKKGVQLTKEKMKGKWTSDKDYMAMMVKDHQQDWAEFQGEAKNGSDPDLKKWAADKSNVIQKHLEMAKKTQSKLK